jgi:hypothetical protein
MEIVKVSDGELKAAEISEQTTIDATSLFQAHDGISDKDVSTTAKVQSELLINNSDELKGHECDTPQVSKPSARSFTRRPVDDG